MTEQPTGRPLWLARMPSTNAVIFCGMLIALLTASRYLLSGVHFDLRIGTIGFAVWTPAGEWLLFVAAMLGIGATQFGVKRTTDAGYQRAKAEASQPQVTARTAEVVADEVTVTPTGG